MSPRSTTVALTDVPTFELSSYMGRGGCREITPGFGRHSVSIAQIPRDPTVNSRAINLHFQGMHHEQAQAAANRLLIGKRNQSRATTSTGKTDTPRRSSISKVKNKTLFLVDEKQNNDGCRILMMDCTVSHEQRRLYHMVAVFIPRKACNLDSKALSEMHVPIFL